MQDKKKYICVTPFFPSPTRWQGSYVLDQVKAIQRHSGWDVVVFKTSPFGQKEDDYEVDGIKVYAIQPPLMPSYILNGMTDRLCGRLFVRKLRAIGIDPMSVAYVHCHTTNHSAFGFGVRDVNPGCKVILQFHDLDPLTLRNGKWADKRWNRLYRAKKSVSALNRADLLLCISEPVKEVLTSWPKPRVGEVYGGALAMYKDVADMPAIKPKDIYVLNNGVDTILFRSSINSPISPHGSIYRIGCVANFQELKDHISLIKAFEILISKGYLDMRLSLLGTGRTKNDCIRYIEEHNLAEYVEWPKEVNHDKLPKYYQSLDLFVLPSVFEGFGCVYTEAAACGVPFMGVKHQGAAEVLAPEECDLWLMEPYDYEQLAKLIERQYLERNEQKYCKEWNVNELVKGYLKYLESQYEVS